MVSDASCYVDGVSGGHIEGDESRESTRVG